MSVGVRSLRWCCRPFLVHIENWMAKWIAFELQALWYRKPALSDFLIQWISRKLRSLVLFDLVIARIKAPIIAMLRTKPVSTGNVWKIRVVGTRKTNKSDAPILVSWPNTKSIEPMINIAMLHINRSPAIGMGMPLDAIKLVVPPKSVNFAGTAFTNKAAMKMRPRTSKILEGYAMVFAVVMSHYLW